MKNAEKEFLIRLSNIWFYQEPPENSISNWSIEFFNELIQRFMYGDDAVFSHPKIQELILIFKDYGFVDYEKNAMTLWYEGKMRAANKLREVLNDESAKKQFGALINALGKTAEKLMKKVAENDKKKRPEFITEYIAKAEIYTN